MIKCVHSKIVKVTIGSFHFLGNASRLKKHIIQLNTRQLSQDSALLFQSIMRSSMLVLLQVAQGIISRPLMEGVDHAFRVIRAMLSVIGIKLVRHI